MKIILSRKGFDSSNGKIASPIFEDGTIISFPIPSNDIDKYSDLTYKGLFYSDILDNLNYKGSECCHVDPDLDQGRRVKKIKNWVPAFGQIDAAATYLKNIGVSEEDIFLFFGNFHHVKKEQGAYRYIRNTGNFYLDNDIQIIWGYLQIGRIIYNHKEQEQFWWHPHSSSERRGNKTNVIFEASSKLSFAPDKPGAGLLKYDIKRVLTLENNTKATWRKNKVYDVPNIIGKRKNSAKNIEESIYYSGIWQELGLVESEECFNWARSIIL